MTDLATSPAVRVLLVEDNPGDARLIQELLNEADRGRFELERLGRLGHAVERLKETDVDIVLLDLGLPDSDGIETFDRVHERAAGRPIVVISGLDDEHRALEAVRAGAQDYLTKGQIDGPLLARVIRHAIERKRADEALRGSEQRLRTLFETVNLIVLGLDASGKVEYVNPFFLKLSGYSEEEALGVDWCETFLPEALRESTAATLRQLLEDGLQPHHRNLLLTKAREERTVSWHNTVLRDPHGRPIGTLSIGEDITEQIHLGEQLQRAQKMEAIGRLAGGIAHDFNNVLTAIIGPAELLLMDMEPTNPIREDIVDIQSAAERAAGLTRQLLAFSRQQVLEPRIVDLNRLIRDIDRMLARMIGEDVECRTVAGADLGTIRADPGQLKQVIMNLAINARDAMPSGGTLTIETSNAELDESYANSHFPVVAGQYVMLAVSDNGVGMDAATRAKIFEPFFTTKAMGKGTGLGLATVYGIVKQSGGYIWAYSEPGHGTTFKIYLPRLDLTPQTVTAGVELRSLAGSETILIVEDEEVVEAVTRRMLEAHGYRVLSAASGAKALEIAQAFSEPIPLLVTDVVMPEMSGREVAEHLSSLRPDTRVLYVSGYTDDMIVHHGVLEPGVQFLQKPFTSKALARKVRQVLDAS